MVSVRPVTSSEELVRAQGAGENEAKTHEEAQEQGSFSEGFSNEVEEHEQGPDAGRIQDLSGEPAAWPAGRHGEGCPPVAPFFWGWIWLVIRH